jgi:hypothetical protein
MLPTDLLSLREEADDRKASEGKPQPDDLPRAFLFCIGCTVSAGFLSPHYFHNVIHVDFIVYYSVSYRDFFITACILLTINGESG